MSTPLVEARGVHHHYFRAGRRVDALRGVDLELAPGASLGLVGASGCGKTTLGRCLLRLIVPAAGQICFEGKDIVRLSERALRPLRQRMQLVFQSPRAAVDPRQQVGAIVGEPLETFGLLGSRARRRARVGELLERVGLTSDLVARYPHEISGGQLQRVCIARALASAPRLLVADEPTSSLDLSAQAQILRLLAQLAADSGLTLLLVTHDLRLLPALCAEVAVMHEGRIVERLPSGEIPRAEHPATRALLAAADISLDG